jgi:hypothetical protein
MIKTMMERLKQKVQSIEEKKDDRCTRIAKSKYDAWPSAYASGAVVRCRAGKIWKDLKETDDNLDENIENEQLEALEEDEGLKKWFDRQGAPGKRNVNPAEDKKEKRDQSILDVDLPQRNAKATNAEALIFKRKSR